MQIEKMRAFIIRVLFYCIILGLAYAVLKYALPFLMPFLVAFLIAFILKPVINWVTQKTKLGRKPVSVLLLIAFYVLAAALITVLGTRLVIFCRDIFYALPQVYDTVVAPALNSLQDTLENWVMALNPTLTDFVESAGNSLSSSLSSMVTAISTGALSAVTNVAGSVPSFLVKFIITIVASFFFVSDYYAITSFLARQLPQKARDMLFKVKEKGVDVIFKFGRAYAILLSITFVELLIGFSLLRVDYALLIALLTAIVDTRTTFIKERQVDLDIPHGIRVEVFPLDAVPKGTWHRRMQIVYALLFQMYTLREAPISRGRFFNVVGKILLHLVPTAHGRHRVARFFEKQMSKTPITPQTEFVTELCSRFQYMRNNYPHEAFAAMRQVPFGNQTVSIPVGAETYLHMAYGDFMQLPPESEQKPKHDAVVLDVENGYETYRGSAYPGKYVPPTQ